MAKIKLIEIPEIEYKAWVFICPVCNNKDHLICVDSKTHTLILDKNGEPFEFVDKTYSTIGCIVISCGECDYGHFLLRNGIMTFRGVEKGNWGYVGTQFKLIDLDE